MMIGAARPASEWREVVGHVAGLTYDRATAMVIMSLQEYPKRKYYLPLTSVVAADASPKEHWQMYRLLLEARERHYRMTIGYNAVDPSAPSQKVARIIAEPD
jgi:hypothetical protein